MINNENAELVSKTRIKKKKSELCSMNYVKKRMALQCGVRRSRRLSHLPSYGETSDSEMSLSMHVVSGI